MLHTILWWKNFKQFFTLTDLEQSYTYIGLLQHNIHVVQYFYSWLRISIFVHSIASDLPLHFTSKFHFVNIILYQLFFLIQMSSIELIFIIFQTSSLPDRKRKQKSVYIAVKAGKHIPTRLPQSRSLKSNLRIIFRCVLLSNRIWFLFMSDT